MLDQIKQVIQPILQQENTALVDIIFRRESGQQVLRLLVDREGGIRLSDCVILNKKISQALEESGVIAEGYILEVDSPGVDRWFSGRQDYERARHRMVRVTLNEAVADKKEHIGSLEEVTDDYIKVDVKKKGTIEISHDKIIRARQEVEF